MTERNQREMVPPLEDPSGYYGEDDGISLKHLLLTFWGYRRVIVVLSIAAAILIIVVAGFIFLGQSKECVAKLPFRLDFEGIGKNQYPNGMKFSTSDILSVPVMNRVYKEDNLDQYLEFPDFRASLAVIQTNDNLRLLEYEYAAKLSDKKLNVDQRQSLETEFLEKKKNTLSPNYTLMWDLGFGGTAVSIPDEQIAKVLNDILRSWAGYADRVKGANQYQISLISPNALSKEDVEGQDYYIAMDIMRLTIKRIEADIQKLETISGAKTLKIGEKRLSLGDFKYRMADLEDFKLSPLVGLVRQTGITKDKVLTAGYLKNRIFELTRKKTKTADSIKVYEGSLSNYMQTGRNVEPGAGAGADVSIPSSPKFGQGNVPAMIPQFGSSFLTSLIEMARENSDAEFRQDIIEKIIAEGLDKVSLESELKYYERLHEQILLPNSEAGGSRKIFLEAASARILSDLDLIYRKLIQTIDEINSLYMALSKANLNPDSLLYSATEPVTIGTERSLSPKKLLMYVVLTWLLAEMMIIFGVLIANVFAKPEALRSQES